MDAQELRNLQEAYSQVHQLDEASYSAKAARAGKDIGKPGKQFAKIAASAAERYGSEERGKKVAGAVLAKLRKEETDLFDVILEHLVAEGYAETNEAALAIMVNMSEEWRQSIVEEVLEEGEKPFPHKKVDRQVYNAMDSGETAGDSGDSAKETRDYDRANKMRSVAAKFGGKRRAR